MTAEAPDASDWANTLIPEFYRFESHLQCPICRELLSRAPTITECGHTFCNECISRHMRIDNKCPFCRQEIQHGKLRLNKIIDDLLDTWISSDLRNKLLKVVQPKPEPLYVVNSEPEDDIVEVSVQNANRVNNTSPKYNAADTNEQNNAVAVPQPVTEQHPDANFGSDEEIYAPSSDPPSNVILPEGHAACPICSKVLPIDVIQSTHIAKCINTSAQTNTKRSVLNVKTLSPRKKRAVFAPPSPEFEETPQLKLTVPSFHAMSESKIRNKLKEAGLSTKGSRQQLVTRYMEWITVWNATTIERHPRSIKELRSYMQTWDRQQEQSVNTNLKSLDTQAWSNSNKDNFDELIAQARASLKKG